MTAFRFRIHSNAGGVLRYSVGPLHFVRRPVSSPPGEGMMCMVDDGDEHGWKNGQTPAIYKGGEWHTGRGRSLKFAPTFWTAFGGEARSDG